MIVTGVAILALLLALAGIAAFVDRKLPTGRFDEINPAVTATQVSPASG